jgi:hypothetical protein
VRGLVAHHRAERNKVVGTKDWLWLADHLRGFRKVWGFGFRLARRLDRILLMR